jgi:hypothetical protein
MIDPSDDLAGAVPPFKVVACIPVHGRVPLLPLTIKRLYQKNDVYKVICVGDGKEENRVCEESGAVWVPSANTPLGAKWNRAFMAAKEFKPDACLYVGSSDWLSNDWLTLMKPHVDAHQMAGVPGCYFMDIREKIRAVNWKGYIGVRADETIGIGRVLSAELLNKIGWKPFDDNKVGSLDRSMKEICSKVGVTDFMVRDPRLKAVSISTGQWENKHVFSQHWNNLLPSEKINDIDYFLKDFPEAIQLQKQLYANIPGVSI